MAVPFLMILKKVVVILNQITSYLFNGSTKYLRGNSVNDMVIERTTVFSVDMWIYPTVDNRTIFSKRDRTTNNRGYQVNISANGLNQIVLQLISTASNLILVRSVGSITLNQWNHITITYNGSSNASGVKIYINGVLQAVTILNNNLTGTILRPTLTPKIGVNNSSTTDTAVENYYNGKITHFKFWYKELSQSEITEIYNKGYFTSVDYTTLSNDIYPKECEVHYPVYPDVWDGSKYNVLNVIDKISTFTDGINEQTTCGTSASLNMNGTQARTIVMWVRTPLTQSGMLVSKQQSGAGYFFNTLATSGKISFRIQRTSTSQIIGETVQGIQPGTWTFVAISYNGNGLANGVKISLNNIPCTFTITADNMGTITSANSGTFRIGAYAIGAGTPSGFFNGYMTNVGFFNGELSDAQKTTLYNMGRDNPDYNSIPGLQSHWRMTSLNPADIKSGLNGTSVNMDASNIVTNHMISVNMIESDKEINNI